ncbi:hypothetical protein D3C87_1733740 [compost metagenome]
MLRDRRRVVLLIDYQAKGPSAEPFRLLYRKVCVLIRKVSCMFFDPCGSAGGSWVLKRSSVVRFFAVVMRGLSNSLVKCDDTAISRINSRLASKFKFYLCEFLFRYISREKHCVSCSNPLLIKNRWHRVNNAGLYIL